MSSPGFVIISFLVFRSLLMAAQLLNRVGQLGVGLALAGGVVNSALFNVDGGHRAVIFDRCGIHATGLCHIILISTDMAVRGLGPVNNL